MTENSFSSRSYKASNSWHLRKYVLTVSIVTYIFALPRHGVPYILNMDRNFTLFCCANFGTAPTFLFHVVGSIAYLGLAMKQVFTGPFELEQKVV